MKEEKLNSGPSVRKRSGNEGMKREEKSRKGERRRSFIGANRSARETFVFFFART